MTLPYIYMKANNSISMHIGTNGPQGKCKKQSTLGQEVKGHDRAQEAKMDDKCPFWRDL